MIDSKDREYLERAIAQAITGAAEKGIPIGSVLRRGDHMIGSGRNRRVQHRDPIAHAEIDCLHDAGRQKTYRDTVLYSTLMPCFLCAGAVVQFRIPRVVVGEASSFPGAEDFMRAHGVVVDVVDDPRCKQLMSEFVAANSDLWAEDIGK